MNTNSVSHSTVLRLFDLYRKIPSYQGAGASTNELYEYLKNEGYDVTLRTLQRDLKKLEDVAEIYSERTATGNVWRNSSLNTDNLPTMRPSEALLLVISEQLVAKSFPPENKDILNHRLEKAHATLNRNNKLGSWKDKLYIVEGEIPRINQDADIEIRKVVYGAVIEEEQISLRYKSATRSEAKEYVLNPLGIVIRDHTSYLVATKQETPDKPQLFIFRRMEYAERLHLEIKKPKQFSVKEYIGSNPTGWLLDKEQHQITLKVKWFALEWLNHNRLHSNQTIKHLDGDWSEVTFKSYITYDLIAWILRYSTDVIVETPSKLRELVIERLEKTMSYYDLSTE